MLDGLDRGAVHPLEEQLALEQGPVQHPSGEDLVRHTNLADVVHLRPEGKRPQVQR